MSSRFLFIQRHLMVTTLMMAFVIGGYGLLRLVHPARAIGTTASAASASHQPPWVYGRADARFTLIEYADLECPYCRSYFPVLKRWIDTHPDVNWQWHHLPLAMHEPTATREARLAECAGEEGGSPAFWQAVAWIYGHTDSNGQGIPASVSYPHATSALKVCLSGSRPDAVIEQQVQDAAHDGIMATPTLRLLDHRSGRALLLSGPEEGDALLSALDWLANPDAPSTGSTSNSRMPADSPVGDMPR